MNKSTLFLLSLFSVITFPCLAMEKSHKEATIQDLSQLLRQYSSLIANEYRAPHTNANDISKNEQQKDKSKDNKSQPSHQLSLLSNNSKGTMQDLSQLLQRYSSLIAKAQIESEINEAQKKKN